MHSGSEFILLQWHHNTQIDVGWEWWGLQERCNTFLIQSSVVIKRYNIVRYNTNNCRNCGRISFRCWIHNRYLVPRPNGWGQSLKSHYLYENWPRYNGPALHIENNAWNWLANYLRDLGSTYCTSALCSCCPRFTLSGWDTMKVIL